MKFFKISIGVKPDAEWFQPLKTNKKCLVVQTSESRLNSNTELLKKNDSKCKNTDASDNVETKTIENISPVSEEEKQQFQSIIDRIQDGLSSNPTVFVPAFRKMLKNAKNFASTKNGLVGAMHTFGTYSGVKIKSKKPKKISIQRSHKTVIGVQPTAIARRKYLLSGRKKLNVGRPTGLRKKPIELAHHDYTSFGTLPKRKRKAPHDLD